MTGRACGAGLRCCGAHDGEEHASIDTNVAEQISAGVLAYECEGEIADIALYKDNALAVLTTGDTRHKGRLAVLPSAALARQPLPEIALHVGP